MEDSRLEARHSKEAEDRLNQALLETGARDPRKSYREMLRELKLKSEADYQHAVAGFQESVLTAIIDRGAEPLSSWLQFGRELAERLYPGRDVVIDETGRARALIPPPSWRDLILHLPDEQSAKGVIVGLPPELTRAQRASVELLAQGSVMLLDP